MSRIKLLLIIPHLGGGGAERITSLLAAHLDRRIFDLHLVVITADQQGAETPPPWVRIHRINATRIRGSFLRLIWVINEVRPNIVLSNMAHLNFLVLMLRPFLPTNLIIVVRQNSTASLSADSWLSRQQYRLLYPRSNWVICQTQAMAEDLEANFLMPSNKMKILANPVLVEDIRRRVGPKTVQRRAKAFHLLAVGRLSHEKAFDILLRAIFRVRLKRTDLCVTIIGTGVEFMNLSLLSRDLNLEANVVFTGHVKDLTDHLRRADLFVLSSRHEGMPNALLEAAAAGLPLVATPCCQGVVDLLDKAPYTWLASSTSPDDLARAIEAALDSINSRAMIESDDSAGLASPILIEHSFLAPFELSTAIGAYQSFLIDVASSESPGPEFAHCAGR